MKTHPLFGKTVLVTRARAQASKLTARLESAGAKVIETPAIEIAPPADNYQGLDAAIKDIASYQWIIFTSVNGVTNFFDRLNLAKKDTRALGYAKIAAIGSATAEELARHGVIADVVPAEFRAEGLIEALKGQLPPHAKILLPRAKEAREILPEKLQALGAEVQVVTAYQTVCGAIDKEKMADLIKNGAIDMVTFTSSSTVKNLVTALADKDILRQVKLACIGPVTAETLRDFGLEPAVIAKEYTIDGLVEAVKENIC